MRNRNIKFDSFRGEKYLYFLPFGELMLQHNAYINW